MRKLLILLLAFILFLGVTSVYAEEATPTDKIASISVYVNDAIPLSWITAVFSGSELYIPAVATANLLDIDANIVEYYSAPATVLTKGERCGYFFNDSYYAIINTIGTDMESPSKIINGILYLPCDIFTSLFDVECIVTEEDGKFRVDLNTKEYDPDAEKYEAIVSNLNLSSSTDYLIWVSKADYSVRLFTKANNRWHFVQEFPCAIGKEDTPTCEGIFRYYEKIEAWKYDKYYVGPVMRFNRGYALHSTLIRYNGTSYDDRVGTKLSAGCVRMHHNDIQYLWDTIPLDTTIYVSAE